MTAPARFLQSDVQRVLKAARKTGFNQVTLVLRPSGEIELSTGPAGPAVQSDDLDAQIELYTRK